MLNENEIIKGTKSIAFFMAYRYFEPEVLVDEEYGLSETTKCIYSKTPIITEFINGDKYLSEVENPDYDVYDRERKWNPNYKTIPWGCLNDYLIEPKYHEDYNILIEVISKINSLGYDVQINSNFRRINIISNDFSVFSTNHVEYHKEEFRGNSSLYSHLTPIECVWSAVVKFVEWYNNL